MPKPVQNLFNSAVTSGGLTAILLGLLLPRERGEPAAVTGARRV